MSLLLKSIGTAYKNYMINVGRQRAREVLLSQSDRTLQDLGLSRILLSKGISHWPWREEDQPMPVAPPRISRREEAKAIRELRALSNHDLRDIGLTRGEIVDAVRHGRPGIEFKPASSLVLEKLAQESISSVATTADDARASNSPDNTPVPPMSPVSGNEKKEAA
ncbi:hypothetical protein AB833_21560 [Chromatiales bacterium (ex Bugula neritina AB1)]|nr:hypothetical protein AB833_21560 [Chromatiales bacterium (ex Bugula neritina AB1)]